MQKKIVPGVTFRYPYADSNPLWKVLRSKGAGIYLCEIVNEPINYKGQMIDSDWAGTQKAFLRKEILARLAQAQAVDSIMSEHERFYKSLTPGQLIHYDDGFNKWVRCVVVCKDNKNVLKPIAIVGEWDDLPHYQVDGSISYHYYGEKIAEGETMEPNVTNLFEFGCKPRNGIDPTTLPAIDLTVPPMTPEQQKIADLWQQVYKIKEVLDGDNPAEILHKVKLLVN